MNSPDSLPPCERHAQREARAAEAAGKQDPPQRDPDTHSPDRATAERRAADQRAAEMEARTSPIGGISRREFVEWMGLAAAGMAVSPLASASGEAFALDPGEVPRPLEVVDVTLTVNGTERSIQVEPRVSLLDALRERMGLAGTRKGCNQGACGACTVHLDDERVNSCLTLAVQADGREVRTIEGLAENGGQLHPMQSAFIEHDGFQCGYCTSGQIMSAVAMMQEADAGQPSWVTENLANPPQSFADLEDDEIRERMSGNVCRCGAYIGMLNAINDVQTA